MPDNPNDKSEHPSSIEEHPSGEDKGSQDGEPKESYTRAEHEAALKNQERDIKREHGREVRTLKDEVNTKTTELENTKTELAGVKAHRDSVQKQLDELEEAHAKGSEAGIDYIRKRNELREQKTKLDEREAKLTASEAQHAEDIKASRQAKWEVDLFNIAQEYGVDANELKELNPSSLTQAEDIAAKLAKAKPKAEHPSGEETPSEEEEASVFEPEETIASKGGKGKLTTEVVDKMPMASLEKELTKENP